MAKKKKAPRKGTKAYQKLVDKVQNEINRVNCIKKLLKAELPFNILGIDPATKTGWATGITADKYGTWDFSLKNGETMGIKLLKFERYFLEYVHLHNIKAISFERPVLVRGRVNSVIHHSKLAGIIQKICAQEQIDYIEYTPGQIKQFATGNGGCGKEEVIKAARKWFNFQGDDDNQADAIWIMMKLKNYLVNEEI